MTAPPPTLASFPHLGLTFYSYVVSGVYEMSSMRETDRFLIYLSICRLVSLGDFVGAVLYIFPVNAQFTGKSGLFDVKLVLSDKLDCQAANP
jgi:hypothetical protein